MTIITEIIRQNYEGANIPTILKSVLKLKINAVRIEYAHFSISQTNSKAMLLKTVILIQLTTVKEFFSFVSASYNLLA